MISRSMNNKTPNKVGFKSYNSLSFFQKSFIKII